MSTAPKAVLPSRNVYIQTFGCQMNEYDSQKMLEHLRAQDYTPTDDPRQADLILINTCAIREKAEHKVFSRLGELDGLKQARPHLVLGVGGCVAQQRGEEILRRAPQVDLVFGTDNLFELPELLREVAAGRRVSQTAWRGRKTRVENFIPAMAPPARPPVPAGGALKAHLAITKGCNNFCTFCVVPYTRGREVSREPENILDEARALAERGVLELTLLGQNVNSYRANGTDFVALLERMQEIPGLARLRYTSPHPKDFNARLARAHAELPKLCEHLHLPFQSGSDRILKAMRRNHGIAAYLDKIAMVREQVPQIAFSTDVIVGFPGETEEDFQATLDVLAQVQFDHLYSFKFSPRTDTPAATYEGQLPEAVKAQRLARLHDLQQEILQARQQALLGSRQQVLLEGPHAREQGAMAGRSRSNWPIVVLGCDHAPGTLIDVEIVAARKFSLAGRMIADGSARLHRDEDLPAGAGPQHEFADRRAAR